ncbi:cobalamin B12-binding domain-containing protein [Streptomyces montanisoli]|uniref:Cobalamin B12-binding domain-containing protein n=1 Tax=Streptomyces montanisoli TaxID=2798581 RepID=A0A940MAD2_9ACTN|nr:cobalamin-dependent protein [Streptomyces montanisoli]MBP0457307.1 cobalamin B12-binding domain-containing protein [Streptomyces montanisoli]
MTSTRPAAAAQAEAGAPAIVAARERLWHAIGEGDEYAAVEVVFAALDDGVPAESALLDLIAPVQHRVGVEWAANRLSVAAEHAASAINDRVIGTLAHHPRARAEPARGRVTVACVDGEWHALPARLLAEVLRLRGWRVDFLGAQVPSPHLVAHLHKTAPDVVALSSSIATRLPMAHAAITACQAAGTPVLVGGAAFGPDGRYARALGADAWAPDARAAADRLAQGLRRAAGLAAHQPVDDLPHLADQEYTMVSRTRSELVKEVLTVLAGRFPGMRSYTDAQRRHTAEDIAHVVEFLATALYVDDAELFTGFIAWTAEILAVRHVPAVSLTHSLHILGGRLADFPRATAMLTQALSALPEAGEDA